LQRKNLQVIILLVVVLAAAICVAVYLAVNQNSANKYEKSIIRNTVNPEEENALLAAEHVNYTDIFKTGRLSNSNLSDYSQDTYANFIDAVVINYYDSRFESRKGKIMGMVFNYNANVSALEKIHVVYVPRAENATVGNETIYFAKVRILSSNGSILNGYYGAMGDRYAYGNNSGIQEIQASAIDFEFSNCYIVDMRLYYDETYGTLAAFISDVHQTVILDESYEPLFICVRSEQAVA
jgi:hypothetical protein